MYILYMFAFIHGICNVHVITGDHYIMDFSTDCSVCVRESIQIVHVIMCTCIMLHLVYLLGGSLICCTIIKFFSVSHF